jgi:hypothetical protein
LIAEGPLRVVNPFDHSMEMRPWEFAPDAIQWMLGAFRISTGDPSETAGKKSLPNYDSEGTRRSVRS